MERQVNKRKHAQGWSWAYYSLIHFGYTVEQVQAELSGKRFVLGLDYDKGARQGIKDWQEEQAEQAKGEEK